MAFSFPPNLMPIAFQILGLITDLVQKAEAANGSGTGAQKKAWFMTAAAGAIKSQDMFKPELMTAEQEASILESMDKGADFVIAVFATAKLFQTPKPQTV